MTTGSNPGSSAAAGTSAVLPRSLLGSKSLWVAIVVTILGAASWAYSAATRPSAPATQTATSALTGQSTPHVPTNERLLDKSAPKTVRYGISFIAAFLVAYAVKKLIKSVLIVAGLVIAAIAGLKYLGIFEYDWSAAQQQVEQGVELAKQESGRFAKAAADYLPSSVAAGLGAVFGARRG